MIPQDAKNRQPGLKKNRGDEGLIFRTTDRAASYKQEANFKQLRVIFGLQLVQNGLPDYMGGRSQFRGGRRTDEANRRIIRT
jgi:hypothetical protein